MSPRPAGNCHDASATTWAEYLGRWRWGKGAGAIGAEERAGPRQTQGRQLHAPDMLISGCEAVAGLPVADPLWRDVDERFAGFEGEPTRRQWPDAFVQDAYKDIFRYKGAASVMSRPAHVP